MEPFVPGPEERISTKESSAGKGVKSGPSSGFNIGSILPALVVAIGLGIFLFFSNNSKNDQIEDLSGQLSSLKQQMASLSSDPASSSESEEPIGGDNVSRLNKLEKLVASQVSDLDTMRTMVAETLSKLDSDLEGSLMNYYEKNRQSIEKLQSGLTNIAGLQSSLDAVKKDIKSLSGNVSSSNGLADGVAKRIDELESALAGQQQSLSQAEATLTTLDRALQTKASSESLNSLELKLQRQQQVLASGTSVDDQLSSEVETLNAKIATLDNALQSKASTRDLDKISAMSQQQQGLAGDIDALKKGLGVKASSQDLNQVAAKLDRNIDSLKQQISALPRSGGSQAPAASIAGAGEFEQKLSRLSRSQNEFEKNLQTTRSQLESLSREIRSEIAGLDQAAGGSQQGSSAEVANLKKQLVALAQQVNQSRAQIATYSVKVDGLQEALDSKIAMTNNNVSQLAARMRNQGSSDSEAQIAQILKTVQVLRKQHPYAEFND